MDQPVIISVANPPTRGQLMRENIFSLSPLFALENFVSRDTFGRPVLRVSPLILHTQAFRNDFIPRVPCIAFLGKPTIRHVQNRCD